jgi:hypothetical protein
MSQVLYIAFRGTDDKQGRWSPVGRLEHGPNGYRFVYTRGAKTLAGFQPFPGMEKLDQVYESDELFPLFANRLLARSRPEYEAYLTWGGFDPNNPPDPIALLGVTEGLRQTDSLEVFPCPQPDACGCYLSKFFLHGVRWMPAPAHERILRLKSGETLGLMLDISNTNDPHAVAVRTCDLTERLMIGYVPRYLAQEVWQLITGCGTTSIDVRVERVNESAPMQQRVLCRINSCWPDNFRPCTGEEFQPLPANVPDVCERTRS